MMKKINKNPGFKVPEHYFEEFNEKLLDKISQASGSLEERSFPKDEGFTVPEGYFENLNQKILEKLVSKETKVIPLHFTKKVYYAVATIAAGLVLFFGLRLPLNEQLNFSDISALDIESYFQDNEMDLSSYEIAEMLPIDQLEINDILDNQIQDTAILDYLDNNTDDLEELNLNYNE